MARIPTTVQDRARGLFLGLAGGASAGGPGEGPGELRLAVELAEELLRPEVDLARLADGWVRAVRDGAWGLGRRTRAALEHLGLHGTPPLKPEADEGDPGPLVRALPIALATYRQPRNLVSGTYHTVLLTHPDPHTPWSAVAINVAAAGFVAGHRDVLPDVIEALRANDAPIDLLGVLRRIPFIPRDEAGRAPDPAVSETEVVLWTVHHDPRGAQALAVVGGGAPGGSLRAALVGALIGARDGERTIPDHWVAHVPDPGRIRDLAKRLVAARGDPL